MDRKHLTEEEIFSYLDSTVPKNNFDIRQHLNNCYKCRSLLNAYRILYEELAREPEYRLSSDFSQHVLQKIKKENLQKVINYRKESLGIASCLLVVSITVFIRFVDIGSIISSFSKLQVIPQIILSVINSQTVDKILPKTGYLPEGLMGVLVILSILLMDRFLLSRFIKPLKYHLH